MYPWVNMYRAKNLEIVEKGKKRKISNLRLYERLVVSVQLSLRQKAAINEPNLTISEIAKKNDRNIGVTGIVLE
uniref:HTH psq-type domain-containing protein n=1 Tax=Syphacia muris TaxID=451379 RepID=A0A0N5AGK3_9BILA